ncbi:MAG: LacI family DNA-binding transcriptional regulator [Armatimonadaceae bacterium]
MDVLEPETAAKMQENNEVCDNQNGSAGLAEMGLPKRRVTITDVASAAGVSRTTVSYVLSGRADARVPAPTRQRVLDKASELGYRRNALAAAFRSGRMNTVGIVSPLSQVDTSSDAIPNVYYRDLVLAIANVVFDAGLNPLLLSETRSRQLSLADVTDRRADGVILVIKENASQFVQAAEAAGVPCVTIGREVGDWQVHTDNFFGARLAVEHLIGLNHQKIAFLWYGHHNVPSARQRLDGFLKTTCEAGFTESDSPVFSFRETGDLVRALLEPDGPTAVFCYNDELALLALDLCAAHGLRVPQDVSLVGFDDNVLARSARPRLTTIHSPVEQLASASIQLLQAQLRGDSSPSTVFASPYLVVRESTAPPQVAAVYLNKEK